MKMGRTVLLKLTLFILFSLVTLSVCSRQYCPSLNITHGKCGYDGFECLDGSCIKRVKYCDRYKDCLDNSDEDHCDSYSACPVLPHHFERCQNARKCIPLPWICDGIVDCPYGDDELNCSFLLQPKLKAIQWLKSKTVPSSLIRKWGPFAYRSAVAFFLSDPTFFNDGNHEREQITYELSIQLLSQISQKKIQNVSASHLALFINAFLVTCINSRDFYGFNLVDELRTRVATLDNNTLPYVILALCNGGDSITQSDVKNLTDIFRSNKREIWTDTQAMVLMALSCARNQPDSTVEDDLISELALKLKQLQYKNGTVENLHNTLLVMQALYAAEADADFDNFNETKAVSYILENQDADGSFGNFALTYYALPVLNCKSLVDISSSHCKSAKKDEDTAFFDFMNYDGPKMHVVYSIWFGLKRDMEKNLALFVPAKLSFYRVMEIAAEIDTKYNFEYIMKNNKPYITSISGLLNDPETGQYWFIYQSKDGKATALEKSPVDIFPENGDRIVMWYRKESVK